MSATGLRDLIKAALIAEAEAITLAILHDRTSTAEILHDNIGYVRGLKMSIDVMDKHYAEMHNR